MNKEQADYLENKLMDCDSHEPDFKNLSDDSTFHPNKKLSALFFLYSKIKAECKNKFSVYANNEKLYVTVDYEDFDPFTGKDVEIALSHSIYFHGHEDEDNPYFYIYASG